MIGIDLKGKVAIVTGVSNGIGNGVAKMLAKSGCDIAGCGRSGEDHINVKELKQDIKDLGQNLFYKSFDISLDEEIQSFVSDVLREYGRIDILVSNAGVNYFDAPENCSIDFWTKNADLNLRSHWLISKACQEALKKNRGTILIMTSNHAYSTIPNCFPYNVTKAGLLGLVNALAIEWGPEIRTIGLAPGFIETAGGEKWFATFDDPDAKKAEIENIHPVKKLGTSEEIGAFCAFLSSEYAAFVTGVTYLIDGGRSAVMQDI